MEEKKLNPSTEENKSNSNLDNKEPLEFVNNLNKNVVLTDLAESKLEEDPVQKALREGKTITPDNPEEKEVEIEIIPAGYEKPVKVKTGSEHHLDTSANNNSEEEYADKATPSTDERNLTEKYLGKQERVRFNNDELNEMSIPELVDAVGLAIQQDPLPHRSEVERLEKAFNKKKKELVADKDNVTPQRLQEAQIQEIRLTDLISTYKKRYDEFQRIQAIEEEQALAKKRSLIDRFNTLINSNEDFSTIRKTFEEIQSEWKASGRVPKDKEKEIFEEYNALRDSFYDLKQINNEYRELDFKKNLEAKEALISHAETLINAENTLAANREISELHARWKEIGPVARELRDELWQRFADLSKKVRERHQEYSTNRKEESDRIIEEKKRICFEVEEIPYNDLKTAIKWDEMKQHIIDLQAKWKGFPHLPHPENNAVYKRFRAACDIFFSQRAIFFKEIRELKQKSLEDKEKLVVEAESLANSTDWSKTANRLKQLQTEWKKAGFFSSKKNEELWLRFRAACNTFFEAKGESDKQRKKDSREIAEKKRNLIEEAKKLLSEGLEENREQIHSQVLDIIDRFKHSGRMNHSQKLHKDFYDTTNKIFEKFKLSRNARRLSAFENRLEAMGEAGDREKLRNEISFLNRKKGHLESEIQNNKNSRQLITSSSKWGNSVIKDLEKKGEDLEKELLLIEEQISLVRSKIDELREKQYSSKPSKEDSPVQSEESQE